MSIDLAKIFENWNKKIGIELFIFFGYTSFIISSYLYRHDFLDDAFIHLEYARNFVKFGFLTRDGTSVSFMSSPGYLIFSLPAVYFFDSVYFLKFAGFVCHAAILVFTNVRIFSANRDDRSRYLLIFMAFCSPFAARWLQDGMDTSLFALIVVLLSGFVGSRISAKNGLGRVLI